MSDLPQLPMAFPALFLAGLAFGLTVCSVTCLPLVGACIMGNSRSGTDGLRAFVGFACGRLVTASLLGALCAALGRTVLAPLGLPVLTLVAGGVTLGAGLLLLFRPRCAACAKRSKAHTPPLLLGLASPLVPCVPYMAMMAAAATAGSTAKGASMALVFTLGTTLSPFIVTCLVMGWVGAGMARKLPGQITGFTRAAGVVVGLFGIRIMWLAIS